MWREAVNSSSQGQETCCQCHLSIPHLAISLQTCESDETAACLNVCNTDGDGGKGFSGLGILRDFLVVTGLSSCSSSTANTARKRSIITIFLQKTHCRWISLIKLTSPWRWLLEVVVGRLIIRRLDFHLRGILALRSLSHRFNWSWSTLHN